MTLTFKYHYLAIVMGVFLSNGYATSLVDGNYFVKVYSIKNFKIVVERKGFMGTHPIILVYI